MRLLACIVTHRPPESARAVVDSVLQTCSECDFLVVNSGRDRSDYPPDLFTDPRITIMHMPVNVGHPGGANVGLHHAFKKGYEFYLLLDDDITILTPDWYAKCLELMGLDDKIGIIGAKILNPDRRTIQWAFSQITDVGWNFHRGEPRESPELNRVLRVNHVQSAFFFGRVAHMQKVGYFDMQFSPSQYEDADYCFRMWLNGFSCVYDGRIEIVHHFTFYSAKDDPTRDTASRAHGYIMDLKYGNTMRFGRSLEKQIDQMGREIILQQETMRPKAVLARGEDQGMGTEPKPRHRPLKIFVTIPHYYNPEGNRAIASLRPNQVHRVKALSTMILRLHENFGRVQFVSQLERGALAQANCSSERDLQIIVVTVGNNHVVNQLSSLNKLFTHFSMAEGEYEPLFLGIKCREIMREAYEAKPNYWDFFCYMEDDIVIHDPLFFDKLSYFNLRFGNDCLLLPNRFGVESMGHLAEKRRLNIGIKIYGDGDIPQRFTKGFPLINTGSVGETLMLDFMYRGVKLRRPSNPHAGCYFLNRQQMKMFMDAPYFLEKSTEFIGPLESSCVLGILKRFFLFKPDPENGDFLEVQHFHENQLETISVERTE